MSSLRPQLHFFLILVLSGILLLLVLLPLPLSTLAQDAFVTSTPLPGETMIEATSLPDDTAQDSEIVVNTPAPAQDTTSEVVGDISLNVSDSPESALTNYALRQWIQQDMIDLVFDQINTLDSNADDVSRALQMTLYEMQQRFPGAPSALSQRETMTQAMLAAPRGSVDMRGIVRPYIAAILAERNQPEDFEFNGFQVDMTVARLDTTDGIDAVVHVLYPAGAINNEDVIYEDYLLAIRNADESYRLVLPNFDLPAAPINGVESVVLQRVADVNQDGLDEMVLTVDDGDANLQLVIAGVRGIDLVNLVEPGVEIRYGQIVQWDFDTPTAGSPVLTLTNYVPLSQSPDWNCLSEARVTWTYQSNFYRASLPPEASYRVQDSMGCNLRDANLFDEIPAAAITTVEAALLEYGVQSPDTNRALLTLSMLYILNGQVPQSRASAQAAANNLPDGSALAQQAGVLLTAPGIDGNSLLDVCEQVVQVSEVPVCNIDGVIGRYLALRPITMDADIATQLETIGFPVRETVEVSEIGRAMRTLVNFDVSGASLWEFAPQRDGNYAPSPVDAADSSAVAIFGQSQLVAPQGVYDALLRDNNPQNALNLLTTLQQNNSDAPIGADVSFLQALSYDLLANRTEARAGYYNTWLNYPRTIWGRLAARHLSLNVAG
ncbi:MAG: tetratricopeptide repeat protein [Aggregatilineales bacterium]